MTGFTVFHPLWAGFYSKPFYRYVAQSWHFLAFVAMFVGLAVSWLPALIKFAIRLPQIESRFEDSFLSQWPTLTIENGVASTPERRPYYFGLDEKTKAPFLTIDTTGAAAELPPGDHAQMLITDHRAIIRKNAAETRVYDLSRVKHLVLTADALRTGVHVFFVAMVPVILAFSAAKRTFEGFLLFLAALVTAKLFGYKRESGSLLGLSFVAMVPVFVLESLWELAGQPFFGEALVWAVLLVGFNAFAVIAAEPEASDAQPAAPPDAV